MKANHVNYTPSNTTSPGGQISKQSKACLPKTSVNVVVIFTVDDDKLVGGNSLVVVIVVEEVAGTTVVLVNVVGELVDVDGGVDNVVPLVLILVVVVVADVVVVVLVVAAVVVVVDVDVGIIIVNAELVNGFSDETLQVLQQRLRRYESRQSIEEQLDT